MFVQALVHLGLASTLASAASSAPAIEQVCSPSGCLNGTATSPLLATDGHTYLIPGLHRLSGLGDVTSPLNLHASATSTSVTVFGPNTPFTFSKPTYGGKPTLGGINVTDKKWESLYLPSGWYALADGNPLWGAIPDRGQLPEGKWEIVGFGSDLCSMPCSHGTCTPNSDNTNATCACAPGWTGGACDTCAEGYYGASCLPCDSSCTHCDDGLTGSGICLAPTGPEACNCEHGSCTTSGGCICAAGWVTDPSVSAQSCNRCADGFFQTTTGQCVSCPAGCTKCILMENTHDIPACLECLPKLELSATAPTTCEPLGTCPDRQYYDVEAGECRECSTACTSCTGPNPSDCAICNYPRGMLNGICEGFDAKTGVCDTKYSGLNGTFVLNNDKNVCDSCPAGCLDCHIPSWNIAKSWSELTCTSCQDGYILQNGSCKKTCGDGTFWSREASSSSKGKEGDKTTGTCQACDSPCTTCSTKGYCTSCPSGPVYNGTCVPRCPEGTHRVGGQCLSCHPDCATCSAPGSPDKCLSCPADKPILQTVHNGARCVAHCPPGSYPTTGGVEPKQAMAPSAQTVREREKTLGKRSMVTCAACPLSCSSCRDSTSCISCRDGYTLSAGSCVAATCDSSSVSASGTASASPGPVASGLYATGLGTCLSAFLEGAAKREPTKASPKKWCIVASVIGGVALLALVAALYIRHERAKTRAATAEFAYQLEENNQRNFVDWVLGRHQNHKQERPRLRELVLRPKARVAKSVRREQGKRGFKEEEYVPPPPPYEPSRTTLARNGSTASGRAGRNPYRVSVASQDSGFTDIPLTTNHTGLSLPCPPSRVAPEPRRGQPSTTINRLGEQQLSQHDLAQLWSTRRDHSIV